MPDWEKTSADLFIVGCTEDGWRQPMVPRNAVTVVKWAPPPLRRRDIIP